MQRKQHDTEVMYSAMFWKNYGCGECLKHLDTQWRIRCRSFYSCFPCWFGGGQQATDSLEPTFKERLQVRFAPKALGLGLVWAEFSGQSSALGNKLFVVQQGREGFFNVQIYGSTVLGQDSCLEKNPQVPSLSYCLDYISLADTSVQSNIFPLHLHTPAAIKDSFSLDHFNMWTRIDRSNLLLLMAKQLFHPSNSCLIFFALLHHADTHNYMLH